MSVFDYAPIKGYSILNTVIEHEFGLNARVTTWISMACVTH